MAVTHRLRQQHDALVIGWNTLVTDNPSLTVRHLPKEEIAHHPVPVILDTHLKGASHIQQSTLPHLLDPVIRRSPVHGSIPPAPLWLCHVSMLHTPAYMYMSQYATVIPLHTLDSQGHFIWRDVFQVLRQCNLESVMVEGGARIIQSALQSDAFDTLLITVSPCFLGPNAVSPQPCSSLQLSQPIWIPSGTDMLLLSRLS